jgi:CRISPR/Cas system-associated exonuclease Cas4 (RecB family)
MSEGELVKEFIEHHKSPSGKWFIELPVGMTVQDETDTNSSSIKHIDAVCLTSKQQELPKEYRLDNYHINPEGESEKYKKYLNGILPPRSGSKTDTFRNIIQSPYLEDETVSIVEVKTGKSSFKAIGQLEAYKLLVEQDYGWDVERQILLSEKRDEVISHVCNKKDIKIVSKESSQ